MSDLLQRFWTDDAKCRGVDPIHFFPPKGDVRSLHHGKGICRACPVRAECLAYRLLTTTQHDDDGIWGGTTVVERRELRRTYSVSRGSADRFDPRSFTEELRTLMMWTEAMDHGELAVAAG